MEATECRPIDGVMEATECRPIDGLRGKALWRVLHKEKVTCPSCNVLISRRALRWRHRCGRAPRRVVDVDALRARLDQKAVEGFQTRADKVGESLKMESAVGDVDGGAVQGSPVSSR